MILVLLGAAARADDYPIATLVPQLLKASVGWMVDATDRSDSHVQVAIGFGF